VAAYALSYRTHGGQRDENGKSYKEQEEPELYNYSINSHLHLDLLSNRKPMSFYVLVIDSALFTWRDNSGSELQGLVVDPAQVNLCITMLV
jgi:hypothetical protein